MLPARVEPVRVEVQHVELLTCDRPVPTNIRSLGDVSLYLADLFKAAGECSTNAGAVRETVKPSP